MTTVHLRSWRVGLCAIIAAMLMTACGETPTAPSTSAPFSTEDLRVGTGLQAVTGSVVSVNYTLWLYQSGQPDNKGTLIETNFGKDPFSFTIGNGSVISGWDKGIP